MTPDVTTVVQAVSWPTLCLIAWKLSGRLERIETTLDLAVHNHMKHIEDDMRSLRAMFTAILRKNADHKE
jgi:hypothetical protein